MVPGPSQAYRTPKGDLVLFVRQESRKGVEGVFCVGVRNHIVFTTWTPMDEAVAGELVNDTAGRREAEVHRLYADQVEQERDALVEVMKRAVRWLSPTQATELRELYAKEVAR